MGNQIENIIFHIDGGLGKNIMATAVAKAIKKAYPKTQLIVVCGYPDVFVNNPNVDKSLHFNQGATIYKDYIENKKAKIFISDPYLHSDFITEENHLLGIWLSQYGLKYDGEQPEIFLNEAEKEHYSSFYKTEKPIMVIQANGGAENQPLKYSWTRDMPFSLVKQLVDQYKQIFTIVVVRRKDQIEYPDTLSAVDNWRSIAVLLSIAKKRILIDSSCQHICAALNLPATVLWIGTNPQILGYGKHKNIVANQPTKEIELEHNFYQKNLFFEDISRFPYNNFEEVFNFDDIIKSLN